MGIPQTSQEITTKLNAILRVLDSYPEAQQEFVAELKELGFRLCYPDSEPSQEAEGTLEPETAIDVAMVTRLARLEQMPADERERVLKSWTPEEHQLAMDQLGGPERFLEFRDRGKG